jgi:hypothetical protein
MGSEWRDCIVVLIDLIDVKKSSQSGIASQIMLRFHDIVARNITSLASIAHAYAWNDSVLVLAYVDQSNASFEVAMRDADKLKRRSTSSRRATPLRLRARLFLLFVAMTRSVQFHASLLLRLRVGPWRTALK